MDNISYSFPGTYKEVLASKEMKLKYVVDDIAASSFFKHPITSLLNCTSTLLLPGIVPLLLCCFHTTTWDRLLLLA